MIVKKAYADWSRYKQYTRPLHEAAIELIEIPRRQMTGKNSADIRLVVDAMDLAWSKEHIDTFVIVSGDSDFSPLVSKLKENGKHVIGIGMKDSTSRPAVGQLRRVHLLRGPGETASHRRPQARRRWISDGQERGLRAAARLHRRPHRENKDPIFASMVKDTMKRKKPSFNESAYGYRSFSNLLIDAEKQGLIKLHRDKKAGWTYVVEGFVE